MIKRKLLDPKMANEKKREGGGLKEDFVDNAVVMAGTSVQNSSRIWL